MGEGERRQKEGSVGAARLIVEGRPAGGMVQEGAEGRGKGVAGSGDVSLPCQPATSALGPACMYELPCAGKLPPDCCTPAALLLLHCRCCCCRSTAAVVPALFLVCSSHSGDLSDNGVDTDAAYPNGCFPFDAWNDGNGGNNSSRRATGRGAGGRRGSMSALNRAIASSGLPKVGGLGWFGGDRGKGGDGGRGAGGMMCAWTVWCLSAACQR